MEEQYMPGGEPPKVRSRKPKPHNPAVGTNQGSQGVVHGQQPHIRKSNRSAQQQPPPPPEVSNWDGYGNADPAQGYPEHYGYDEQYVDAHGYGYGGAQGDAGQGYGYDNAGQGYGYGSAQVDAGQGYGYSGDQVNAGQGYGYGGAQEDGQEYGYVAPNQPTVKGKNKTRKSKPAADGVYRGEYQGSYENQHQVDGYGQPVGASYEGSYENQHQVDEYGHPVHDGYGYPEAYNAAPEQQPHRNPQDYKREPSKGRRVKSVDKGNHGDRAYVDPNAGAYAAQHGEPAYGVNYDNGMVPTAGVNSKGRKNNTSKQCEDFPVPTEETAHGFARVESALTSRAISHARGSEQDGSGSARSRTSQEGSGAPGRSKSSDRDGSGSNRSKPHRDGSGSGSGSGRVKAENEARSSREGLTPSGTPRLNAVGGDGGSTHSKSHHRDVSDRSNPERGSSRSKEKLESEGRTGRPKSANAPDVIPPPVQANPLNEHLRKMGGGKPNPAYNDMSIVVFHDPNDRTLIMNVADVAPNVKNPKNRPKEAPKAPGPPAKPSNSLDEWMKKQGVGNNFNQHDSLIVGISDDVGKEMLETQIFGAPLMKKQSMKLPPVVETPDRPQYQPRRDNNQYQPVVEKPLYQPAQRRPHANTPLLPSNDPQVDAEAGASQEDNAEGKQIQPVVPNAKCMACVHGIGVPLARIATRIACRQCLTCGCTIL